MFVLHADQNNLDLQVIILSTFQCENLKCMDLLSKSDN